MGAVMKTIERDGEIIHVSTGKLLPGGDEHVPDWSEWVNDTGMQRRYCKNEDCDQVDWR